MQGNHVATSVNGLNQNAAVGGTSWTYDANGNLTSDGTRTFSYDPENRLLTESGPITMSLAYDPTGRLEQSVMQQDLQPKTTTNAIHAGNGVQRRSKAPSCSSVSPRPLESIVRW